MQAWRGVKLPTCTSSSWSQSVTDRPLSSQFCFVMLPRYASARVVHRTGTKVADPARTTFVSQDSQSEPFLLPGWYFRRRLLASCAPKDIPCGVATANKWMTDENLGPHCMQVSGLLPSMVREGSSFLVRQLQNLVASQS